MMQFKILSQQLIVHQRQTGRWSEANTLPDGSHICLTNNDTDTKILIHLDRVNKQALIEATAFGEAGGTFEKTIPATLMFINNTINLLLKALHEPSTLSVEELFFILKPNMDVINSLISELDLTKIIGHDGFSLYHLNNLEIAFALLKIYLKLAGSANKRYAELFEQIFGIGTYSRLGAMVTKALDDNHTIHPNTDIIEKLRA